MATPTSTSNQPDSAQYEAALAHLERLQDQLDQLRMTMPMLVAPITRPPANKADLFAQVKKNATTTTDRLRTLREDWASEKTQEILGKARESFEKDSNCEKANDVLRWGWARE